MWGKGRWYHKEENRKYQEKIVEKLRLKKAKCKSQFNSCNLQIWNYAEEFLENPGSFVNKYYNLL